MPKAQKHPKNQISKQQIIQATKRKIFFFITTLLTVLLVLIFRIGEALWLTWIIQYRKPIIGIVSFITLYVFFSAPVVIEANSNPRTLSGPGKNPRNPWGLY
ncbi:MAG: hypothetical protein IPP66_15090 [Anaerolineales bacterium]|nr:hypothetical protein [Anaerolineales bacterium]